jgi:hypothetical protein
MIEDDIRVWSKHVLEVPNTHLAGLPACPYAKQAWVNNKVSVIETDNVFVESLSNVDQVLSGTYDLLICASYELPDADEMNRWVQRMNETMAQRDAYFMCFHPDYGAEEAELDFLYEHEWESAIEDEYCMIFVQRLTDVDNKSVKLEKLGYYEAFNPDDYDNLVTKRRQLRKKYHGNETSCNAKEQEARSKD